jgi:PEGA domain-containing protein
MKAAMLLLLAFALAGYALRPAVSQTDDAANSSADHARVFITDSQSWEVGSHSGGGGGAFASEGHGGARPQTAEIIKTFGERCPDVVTNNIQSKVDYIVLLDHEGGKSILSHKNKVAVFARISGDSVVSKSTLSLGGSVQTACEAIRADWAKNAAIIHAAAAAEAGALAKPAIAATAQVVPVAVSSATKISINSTPAGADIEVDGAFVGNTPSTIEVATGDHTVTVSKNGFKSWERKLKAGGGNVNLTVELETK